MDLLMRSEIWALPCQSDVPRFAIKDADPVWSGGFGDRPRAGSALIESGIPAGPLMSESIGTDSF
jgi:hypothetical protein